MDSSSFYNLLAPVYGDMTESTSRLAALGPVWDHLRHRWGFQRVVDMGCGTGLHTRVLGERGCTVLGLDPSREMRDRAREFCASLPAVRIEDGDFFSPLLAEGTPFDLLVCLGNTLPHLEDAGTLEDLFRYWLSCLAPGGRIMVQLLNYDRIQRDRERIVAVRRAGALLTVRFYDFTEPRLTFNILTIDESGERPKTELMSTTLLPLNAQELQAAALAAGAGSCQIFGTLSGTEYTEQSTDLVLVLERNQIETKD